MKKVKCSCGEIWFTDEEYPVCDSSDDGYTGQRNHVVKETRALSTEDYVTMWESDLENANRPTDVPERVLETLERFVENKNVVRKIMRDFYKKQIGV